MLDSSVYLASYGWKGEGNGLRQGSASRPLSIPQKRTLAGLGKDRDEAFPFWDHLFAAAAKSIQIKLLGDEDGAEGGSETQVSLLRTTTGILSNRRPVAGTPATSGTTTPSDLGLKLTIPRRSLMAIAKRDSARKSLYSSFFRGPTLGPDTVQEHAAASNSTPQIAEDTRQNLDRQSGMKQNEEGQQKLSKEKKKRKRTDDGNNNHRKKQRPIYICGGLTQDAHEYEEQPNSNVERDVNGQHVISNERSKDKAGKAERKKLKEDRRNRREERRKRREERRKRKERRNERGRDPDILA